METVEFELLRAEGWTVHAADACYFWYNSSSGETTWLRPSCINASDGSNFKLLGNSSAFGELVANITSPMLAPQPPSSIRAYASLMDTARATSDRTAVPTALSPSNPFSVMPTSRCMGSYSHAFISSSAVKIQMEINPKVCHDDMLSHRISM